ncbi:uncharacterized protein LOC116917465 [Daphnia magna]|uniref:uncharacterized protein LOC116917465 n=1 Tax=Daphnia magna TaxID=35525 RepID=UPI001E1BC784|nr:uncharacterized protein LOC116917465 [Daphnia magna]
MALVPTCWIRDSSNPVHVFLEKLFQDGTIEGTTQSKTIYDAHEIFKPFSLGVFRNVFNELKSSNGLLLRKRQAEVTASNESSSSSRGLTKVAKLDEEEGATAFMNLDSRFNNNTQPIVVSVYKDHVTEQEKVIILCVLPNGADEIRFRLIGSGPGTMFAVIEYAWTPIAYEIEALFGDEIKKAEMATCDPKILALKDDLKFTRQHKAQAPKGSIEINLPIPVQTAANTIKREGKTRKDGSQAILVELIAYQFRYTVKREDEKIVFKTSDVCFPS